MQGDYLLGKPEKKLQLLGNGPNARQLSWAASLWWKLLIANFIFGAVPEFSMELPVITCFENFVAIPSLWKFHRACTDFHHYLMLMRYSTDELNAVKLRHCCFILHCYILCCFAIFYFLYIFIIISYFIILVLCNIN